jgi:hypothetical protein
MRDLDLDISSLEKGGGSTAKLLGISVYLH